MRGFPIPLPTNRELYNWATKLTKYLEFLEKAVDTPGPKVVQLEHRRVDAKATTDGLMMYCPVEQCVIVAQGGEWHRIDLGAVVPNVGIRRNEPPA